MTLRIPGSLAAVSSTGLLLPTSHAWAADLDGTALPSVWALPFVGILLSIALGPLIFTRVWHRHYGKIAAFWVVLTIAPLVALKGVALSAGLVLEVLLSEYLPFVLLLLALFTAAGGIVVRGNLHGTPFVNVCLLAIGSAAASVIGTTGASMILIRPLMRANDHRKSNSHVVIFFLFLVSNIGGALTPLGDPPLFLGFLRGIDFFWTVRHLWRETLFAVLYLLAIFFVLDGFLYRRNGETRRDPTPDSLLRVTGLQNIALIGLIVAAIIFSGFWRPGIALDLFGTRLELQNLIREITMVVVTVISLIATDKVERIANGFEWGPIVEVAILFAAIFLCIIPVTAILDAGPNGAFAPIFGLLTHGGDSPSPAAFFWATGLLSSLLDNAPTYLVFFEAAGGRPDILMGPLAQILSAISAGAVFMGATTYLGNAPNFMVYAIARRAGIRMPGFFGYMGWSGLILMPLFVAMTALFFR